MNPITATDCVFIKLGSGGIWERECIENSTLKVGYDSIPHELCAAGNWDAVQESYAISHPKSATRFTNELRRFYEAGQETLWITFYAGHLWWTFASGQPTGGEDGHKSRPVSGWSKKSVEGILLDEQRLSSRLTQVKGFRGTICTVKEAAYLMRKINGHTEPDSDRARNCRSALLDALVKLIQSLTWWDFELLTDLVFSAGGWRRISVLGKTEKAVDLDVEQPVTRERAMVQVKSKVSASVIQEVENNASHFEHFSRVYLVSHTGTENLPVISDDRFEIIGPKRLAELALDAGLTDWIIARSD